MSKPGYAPQGRRKLCEGDHLSRKEVHAAMRSPRLEREAASTRPRLCVACHWPRFGQQLRRYLVQSMLPGPDNKHVRWLIRSIEGFIFS